MSINNINSSYYTNSTIDYNKAHSAEVVVQSQKQKSFLEHSSSNQNFDQKNKESGSSKFYLNVAQELFEEVASGFNELKDAAFENLHPSFFSGKNYISTQYNLIDLKRHQNYFDQMMNFDNPAGSWIDKNI